MPAEVIRVVAPNDPIPSHLTKVVKKMTKLGAPVIRIVHVDGDEYWAVEGSHRLAAAAMLGLTPMLVLVEKFKTSQYYGAPSSRNKIVTRQEFIANIRWVECPYGKTYLFDMTAVMPLETTIGNLPPQQ